MYLKTSVMLLANAALALLAGCGHSDQGPSAATQPAAMQAADQKGGAELWSENCSRCHNLRPPQSYSDAQWQAIVMHMRLRADLTGPETRKITEFLQASH